MRNYHVRFWDSEMKSITFFRLNQSRKSKNVMMSCLHYKSWSSVESNTLTQLGLHEMPAKKYVYLTEARGLNWLRYVPCKRKVGSSNLLKPKK